MVTYNRVTLCGYLSEEPVTKETNNGGMICEIKVALKEMFKGRDGSPKSLTNFATVSLWGQLADNCSRYLHKGSLVLVEGKITSHRYKDVDYVGIQGQNVQFLQTSAPAPAQQEEPQPAQQHMPNMDDIPF